jgi:hypothetical protein
MTDIELTVEQQIRIVNEFWDLNYNGIPSKKATHEDIIKWIECHYNCNVTHTEASWMSITFEDDKDLTFFLLNHP